MWTAICGASLPQHSPVLLCPTFVCVHSILINSCPCPQPTVYGLAWDRGVGNVSLSRWGPGSSHDCGPQQAI